MKHRQVKLMVWGCFWGNQRSPLIPLVNGTVTARVYRELLRHWLLPVLEDVRAAVGNPLSSKTIESLRFASRCKKQAVSRISLAILTRKFASTLYTKLANLHLRQTKIQHSRNTPTTPIMSCRRTLLQRER